MYDLIMSCLRKMRVYKREWVRETHALCMVASMCVFVWCWFLWLTQANQHNEIEWKMDCMCDHWQFILYIRQKQDIYLNLNSDFDLWLTWICLNELTAFEPNALFVEVIQRYSFKDYYSILDRNKITVYIDCLLL